MLCEQENFLWFEAAWIFSVLIADLVFVNKNYKVLKYFSDINNIFLFNFRTQNLKMNKINETTVCDLGFKDKVWNELNSIVL